MNLKACPHKLREYYKGRMIRNLNLLFVKKTTKKSLRKVFDFIELRRGVDCSSLLDISGCERPSLFFSLIGVLKSKQLIKPIASCQKPIDLKNPDI